MKCFDVALMLIAALRPVGWSQNPNTGAMDVLSNYQFMI